jgi:predicted aminopeptidase
MFKKKYVALACLFALTIGGFFYADLLYYLYGQAKGQFRILWYARPVKELLAEKQYPDSVLAKLQLIQAIKQYAEDSLGINPSENYTTFYDQQGRPLLWNVTACLPYSLTPYVWEFPLLGKVSYKGFFDQSKAAAENKRLMQENWDTNVYVVSGWSTLGFFKDPVLSAWLRYSEGRLANLLIHELTHGTLYVKDNVEYNENLASFVGDEGAKRFLAMRYGTHSKQLADYLQAQADEHTFRDFVLAETQNLDSLYKALPQAMTETAKKAHKQDFMQGFVERLQTKHFYNQRYCQYFAEELPNNTFFMSYLRYNAQQSMFKQEFEQQFGANFNKYMQHLKATYRHSL